VCVTTFVILTHVIYMSESVTSASASGGQELELHEKRRDKFTGRLGVCKISSSYGIDCEHCRLPGCAPI
jgi:hypothetical protein